MHLCSWRGAAKRMVQQLAIIGRASNFGVAVLACSPICMDSTQTCACVGDSALPVLVLLNIFTRYPEAWACEKRPPSPRFALFMFVASSDF